MGPNLKIDGDLVEDFVGKMKLTDDCRNSQNEDGEKQRREEKHEGRGGGDDDEEEEFTFDCVGASNSFSISAEDIFHNGQIRPVFPLFDQSLLFRDGDLNKAGSALRPPLRKLFVEEEGRVSSLSSSSSEEPEGPYCAWAGKAVEATPAPGACKKSNSTGFSKLRRFRELVLRSNSDGKDAFVFLHSHNNNPPVATENAKTSKAPGKKKWEGAAKVAAGKKGKKKEETASSVHEKLYGRRKKSDKAMKGAENRRRSYLPYRQDLVGFFTSSNGLSKNVHPY